MAGKEFDRNDLGSVLDFSNLKHKRETSETAKAYEVIKAQLDDFLNAIDEGKDLTPIAEQLGISVSTVRQYVRRAKKELKVERAKKTRLANKTKASSGKNYMDIAPFPKPKTVVQGEMVE